MSDTFTSTTRTGFFSGIKNAIVGTFMGLIMVPASVGLLAWNEYRTIHRTRALNEGAELVQTVEDPAVASSSLAGSLIHLNGKADTQERLRDNMFGVEEQAIRLTRNAEMYQWVESKKTKKKGNRKKTTYEYDLKWASGREDHASFEHPDGHENPNPKFTGQKMEAANVNLGGYILNKSLINSIHSDELVALTDEFVEALPEEVRGEVRVSGEFLYWSKEGEPNSETPQLGDQRISFEVVRPTNVSLVSATKENAPEQLQPYTTTNGEKIEKLYVGDFTAAEVFEKMQGENSMWAWIFRGGGFLISFVGFTMIFGVLSAFTDWIPLVGSMTRGIIGFVAFLMAVVLTTMTIAFAWIAVRPLFAIPLIVVGVVAAVMAWRSSRKKPMVEPATVYATEGPTVLSADDVVN